MKGKKKKLVLKKSIRQRFYFSYSFRLISSITIFMISFIFALILATKSFEYENSKEIKYNETGALNYKVYLKENDYYDEPYLGENMRYVASLIDNINIDFGYDFNIDDNITLDFDYKIVGELVIASATDGANFLTKPYTLIDAKHASINNENNYSIRENVVIDYDYYNSLANGFKSSYAVDTNSYLKVALVLDKSNNEYKELLNGSELTLSIPLSERDINIKFDSNGKNITDSITTKANLVFNLGVFIVEVICIFIAIYGEMHIIRLVASQIKPKSAYDKFISRVLKEYDRLIVSTTTGVNLEDCHIIKVLSFEELLDVRDNLKLPIMYHNITKLMKSEFYIKHNNDIYLLTVKAVDMEE